MPTYACRYGRVCDAAQAAATLLPVVVGGDGSEEEEAACSRYSVYLRYCSFKGCVKGSIEEEAACQQVLSLLALLVQEYKY